MNNSTNAATQQSFKARLTEFFDNEHVSSGFRRIHIALATLIFLNLFALILETVPEIYSGYKSWFNGFELFSVSVFIIEYLLRLWTAQNKWHFIRSPLAIIDLLAIVPSLIPFLPLDLRFLRLFRLFRLLRILKLVRYSHALQILGSAFYKRRHELMIAIFIGLFLLTLSSSIVYFFEHPAQPDKFRSIPESMWWAAATLTTVGYGDIYPVTVFGRIFGACTAFLGVGMFALPAGILASAISDELKENPQEEKKCPHCGKVV